MKNIKKNLLACVAVAIQGLILFLLVFYHGNSGKTDQLFLCLSLIGISQLIILMPFDQFVVYFNKIKEQKGGGSATGFYIQTMCLSSSVGVMVAVLFFVISTYFSQFINGGRSLGPLNGFIYSLPAYAIVSLNDRYLNATGEVLKSYMLVLVPNLALFLGVASWVFINPIELEDVGYVYTSVMILGAIISSFYILKGGYSGREFLDFNTKSFVIDSMAMRLGHNIYTISLQVVVNYVLLGFYDGALSIFNYAYRSVVALFTVAVGPSNRVYMYELAVGSAKKDMLFYEASALRYLKESMFLYFSLFLIFLTLLLVFYYFDVVTYFDNFDFDLSGYIFLVIFIGLWQALVIVESVYVGVFVTHNNSKVFISINVLFCIVFFLLSVIFSGMNNIYFFSMCGFFAQLLSCILYRYILRNKMYIKVGV